MNIQKWLLTAAVVLGMAGSALAQDVPADGSAAPAAPAAESGDTSAAPAGEMIAPSASEKKLSAALILGYGLTLNDSKTGGLNIYSLGFGLRGGYKVTPEIYLGAKFMYFIGDSIDIPTGLGSTVSASIHEITFGLEGGYDLAVAPKMIVRPLLGLGLGITSADPGSSDTDLYISLGGAFHYDVTDDIYVGGELQLPILFATNTVIGLHILATAGMRF
jgi:hypothetical protein